MALRAFKEGDAFLASVDGGVLTVPMHRDVPEVKIGELACCRTRGWLAPQASDPGSGELGPTCQRELRRQRQEPLVRPCGSGRILAALAVSVAKPLPEKESAVLTALRQHVRKCGRKVDLDTRRALGISDYLA